MIDADYNQLSFDSALSLFVLYFPYDINPSTTRISYGQDWIMAYMKNMASIALAFVTEWSM